MFILDRPIDQTLLNLFQLQIKRCFARSENRMQSQVLFGCVCLVFVVRFDLNLKMRALDFEMSRDTGHIITFWCIACRLCDTEMWAPKLQLRNCIASKNSRRRKKILFLRPANQNTNLYIYRIALDLCASLSIARLCRNVKHFVVIYSHLTIKCSWNRRYCHGDFSKKLSLLLLSFFSFSSQS